MLTPNSAVVLVLFVNSSELVIVKSHWQATLISEAPQVFAVPQPPLVPSIFEFVIVTLLVSTVIRSATLPVTLRPLSVHGPFCEQYAEVLNAPRAVSVVPAGTPT